MVCSGSPLQFPFLSNPAFISKQLCHSSDTFSGPFWPKSTQMKVQCNASLTSKTLHICFFFFFCCTHGMWKFPGQGSNPHHNSDLSRCSDNTSSLT